jgi:hypothetical protein
MITSSVLGVIYDDTCRCSCKNAGRLEEENLRISFLKHPHQLWGPNISFSLGSWSILSKAFFLRSKATGTLG